MLEWLCITCGILARNSARRNSLLRKELGAKGLTFDMQLNKDLQDSMIAEIEEHWKNEKTKEKFTQLRRKWLNWPLKNSLMSL